MDRLVPHAATFVLAAILVAAAVVDWRTRRIPNVAVAALLLAGLAQAVAAGGGGALLRALAGVAVGGLALAVPYTAGLIGAGDVKLMAATGAWLGPGGVVVALVLSAIAGGLLAAWTYARSAPATRRAIRQNLVGAALRMRPPERGDVAGRPRVETVPYGVAVAAGGLCAYLAR